MAYRTPPGLDVRPTDRVRILRDDCPKRGVKNRVFWQAIKDAVDGGHAEVAQIVAFAKADPRYSHVPVLAEIRHDLGRGYLALDRAPAAGTAAPISVRLDDEVREMLEGEARSRGLGLSAYLRQIAKEAAQQLRRERIRQQSRAVGAYVAQSPEAAEFYEDWGTPRITER